MNPDTADTITQVLISAAIILVPIIAGYIARLLKQYSLQLEKKLKTETTAEEYAFLVELSKLAVSTAEQIAPQSNEEKLNYAMSQLVRVARTNDIPLTATDARMLIEGVLKGVKLNLPKTDPSAKAAEIPQYGSKPS